MEALLLTPGRVVAVAPHSRRARVDRRSTRDQLACAPRKLALAFVRAGRPATHCPGAALRILQPPMGITHAANSATPAPTRRAQPGARIVFPLLGLVAVGIATYAWAQGQNEEPGITAHGTCTSTTSGTATASRWCAALARMHMWGSIDDSTRSSPRAGMVAGITCGSGAADAPTSSPIPTCRARRRSCTRD